MAAKAIRFSTIISAVVLVAAIEWSAPWLVTITDWPALVVLGVVRLMEIAGLIAVILFFEKGLESVGWAPRSWLKGLKTGALWSLVFALIAAAAMVGLYLIGRDPLQMVRAPMPQTLSGLLFFFGVAGLIGPLAEEICFRGLIYSFFRRWGVAAALVASTALFVVLHAVHGFPIVQIIGGIVFALAYEISGNLMTPMVIHVLGNSAIFALSLPCWTGFP